MKQTFSPHEAHHLNERLRRSLDNLVDGYVLLSPVRNKEGRITDFIYAYANKSAAKFVGISQDDIIGRSMMEMFPSHRSVGLFDKYIEVADTGIPLTLESFQYDGYYFDRPFKGVFDILAARLDDDVAVSWHDVTSYRSLIDKLTKQKTRFEILSDLTENLTQAAFDYESLLNIIAEKSATLIGDGCVIALISDENEYLECASLFHRNSEAKKLLNEVISSYSHKSDESIVGEAIMSQSTVFLPFVDKDEVKLSIPEAYHKYIDEFGIFSLMIVPLQVYGDAIGVIALLRDETQEPYAQEDIQLFEEIAIKAALFIYNARLYKKDLNEMNERKKAEDGLKAAQIKLEEANRELQSFAYVTSHDLKEPLRMVSGFMDLLSRRYKGKLDEDADKFIQFAVDGARRVNKMISDILEYSRVVTRGKDFEEIESLQVLQITLENLARVIVESNAEITYDNNLPKVKADPTQLERIFQNLITNAIKFNENQVPKVHIGYSVTDDEWIFTVRDNGIGISQAQYENIFMLFKRLYPETYPGSGSGLPITKRIIDRHGGRIWVDSEEGKGSTFFFTIPTGQSGQ